MRRRSDAGGRAAESVGRARESDADEPIGAFGIALTDDRQRRGTGVQPMRTLVDGTRDGIVVLADDTPRSNAAMVAVARRLGFVVAGDPRDGTLCRPTRRLVDGVATWPRTRAGLLMGPIDARPPRSSAAVSRTSAVRVPTGDGSMRAARATPDVFDDLRTDRT